MAVKSGWSLIWPHSSQALCEDSVVYGEVLLVQDSDIMNGFLVRLVSCMTPKSCNTVINARHRSELFNKVCESSSSNS